MTDIDQVEKEAIALAERDGLHWGPAKFELREGYPDTKEGMSDEDKERYRKAARETIAAAGEEQPS